MTMLSFRVDEAAAASAQHWAERPGLDRSELLRQAPHTLLVQLQAEEDAAAWERVPATAGELALADAADWGLAEDWSDWADAAG